jgi:hypothetical protein
MVIYQSELTIIKVFLLQFNLYLSNKEFNINILHTHDLFKKSTFVKKLE